MMQVEGQVKNRTEEIYKKDAEINSLKVSLVNVWLFLRYQSNMSVQRGTHIMYC